MTARKFMLETVGSGRRPMSERDAPRIAYARAGVDVAAGERAVELMRAAVESTRRPEVLGGLGGFGSAFAIPDGRPRARDRVVDRRRGDEDRDRGGDGAVRHDRHRPRRDVRRRRRLLGRRAASRSSTTSPSGGWTRERRGARGRRSRTAAGRRAAALVGRRDGRAPGPDGGRRVRPRGVLHRGGRAVAGCSTGRRRGPATRSSGLASSGLHANGYSLVRALVARARPRPAARRTRRSLRRVARRRRRPAAASSASRSHALATLGDVLLTPTRDLRPGPARDPGGARRRTAHEVRGIAHITGGGLPGNVPRALPGGTRARGWTRRRGRCRR